MTSVSNWLGGIRRRDPILRLLDEDAENSKPLIYPPGEIGLIWSAKSACTTSLLWYLAIAGLLEEAIKFNPWPHRFREDVLSKHPVYKGWIDECDPHALRWIRVIRDPYNRAVSSYRQALRSNSGNAKMENFLGHKLQRLGFSFVEVLEYLSSIDIGKCDGHHREQWSPLERLVTPSRIVNADREPLLDTLLAIAAPSKKAIRSRLSEEVERIASGHHARRSNEYGDSASVVFHKSATEGLWPDYDAFVDAKTRPMIRQIYTKDCEAYAAAL